MASRLAPPDEPAGREPDEDGVPPDPRRADVTRALAEARDRDPEQLERLVTLLYDDLRRVAHDRLRKERSDHTLGTTGLVHEAYLRLLGQHRLAAADRDAFLAAASNTMRRVLVDYARTRNRDKRGGGVPDVPLDAVAPFLGDRDAAELIELDDALTRLEREHPRAARVFELRAFGGLLVEEIASQLGVSSKTVERDWTAARAWLRKEVRRRVEG